MSSDLYPTSPELSGQYQDAPTGLEPEISGARPCILVLDRGWFEGFIGSVLEHQQYRVVHLTKGDQVMETIRRERPRLFIASPRYTHPNFMELCRTVRSKHPTLSIVLWWIFPPDAAEADTYRDMGVLFLVSPDHN